MSKASTRMVTSEEWRRGAWAIALVLLSACGGGRCPEAETPVAASGPLAGYAWLAGTWVAEDGDDGTRTEETWTLPRGTVMPGTSHTEGADGATRFWESLRIERHGDVVQYVARPMGAEGETAFRAVEAQEGLAVFENGEHDFPQRIRYQLEAPGLLRATISDLQGAAARSWLLRRESR
jgi:hypothetical protein